MSVLKFLVSKRFFRHIVAAIALIIISFIATFITLNIYTHHGDSFATPDFSGLTEQQFIDLIQQKELRYKIIDSVHINNYTPGAVVEQTPKSGSRVKVNRTIFFTINAYTAEKVTMPNLIDFSLRNAQVTLESYGLSVGQLIYIPSEYTQLVLGQHYEGKPIEPGTSIKKGTSIDLLVGQGLSNIKTDIPNLKGLTLEQARSLCQNNSLNIDVVIYDDSIANQKDSLEAFVWKQLPDAQSGQKLRLGSSLEVWLTKDSTKIATGKISVSNIDETFINQEDN
jgi:beta-lactam-binding protein with PASTA domain